MEHRYLTDSAGALLKFERMLDELCSVCNPNSRGAKLGILSERDRSETVQCEACDFQQTRPKKNAPGKRMNDGT
jgi:hypothetical protein